MNHINVKRVIKGSIEDAVERVSEELKKIGFGILTRIDFDKKIKEKLSQTLEPVVILGACNPSLAYEAYKINTDVTSLLPCNVVLRQVEAEKVSVEIVLPSKLMKALGETNLEMLATQADSSLKSALANL